MALTLRLVRALESEILSIPDNCILPGTTHPSLPYVVVGDEAFLVCYVHIEEEICQVMKSESLYLYSVYVYLYELCIEDKAIFKYRLSHGHRVIENYFGILVAYGVPFVNILPRNHYHRHPLRWRRTGALRSWHRLAVLALTFSICPFSAGDPLLVCCTI